MELAMRKGIIVKPDVSDGNSEDIMHQLSLSWVGLILGAYFEKADDLLIKFTLQLDRIQTTDKMSLASSILFAFKNIFNEIGSIFTNFRHRDEIENCFNYIRTSVFVGNIKIRLKLKYSSVFDINVLIINSGDYEFMYKIINEPIDRVGIDNIYFSGILLVEDTIKGNYYQYWLVIFLKDYITNMKTMKTKAPGIITNNIVLEVLFEKYDSKFLRK